MDEHTRLWACKLVQENGRAHAVVGVQAGAAKQPYCSAGNPKGVVCNVIAQLGSQALMQHQAGLVMSAGRTKSVTMASVVQALASALTLALRTPVCTRALPAMV